MDYYKHGLSSIFWGLLIAFLNFNINEVSVLPNFIGFLLILTGLREVSKKDQGVKSVISWVNWLVIISAISWFSSFIRTDSMPPMKQQVGFITVDLPVVDLFFIMDGIETLFTLIFVFLLMNYFIHLVQKSSDTDWEIVFIKRRNFYAITNGLMLFGMPFFIIFPVWLITVFTIILFLSFIAFIRILMTAYRMKKLFENVEDLEKKEEDKLDVPLNPFLLRKKTMSISALFILVLSWAGSIFWVEQWRLEEPLLLPAFIATVGDEHRSVYYLHNGRDEQQGNFMNLFDHFQQNTVYVESYFSIDQLYFPQEDNNSLRELSNGELTLYDGTRLKNNGSLELVELPKLNADPIKYLELQNGSGNADGYTLTFKVKKSFIMKDELALRFSDRLHDYFKLGWKMEGTQAEINDDESRAEEYSEGEIITFSISHKEQGNFKQLATFQAPIRIVVDGGEGEEMIDVGWIEHFPSYELSPIQEYVRKFKE